MNNDVSSDDEGIPPLEGGVSQNCSNGVCTPIKYEPLQPKTPLEGAVSQICSNGVCTPIKYEPLPKTKPPTTANISEQRLIDLQTIRSKYADIIAAETPVKKIHCLSKHTKNGVQKECDFSVTTDVIEIMNQHYQLENVESIICRVCYSTIAKNAMNEHSDTCQGWDSLSSHCILCTKSMTNIRDLEYHYGVYTDQFTREKLQNVLREIFNIIYMHQIDKMDKSLIRIIVDFGGTSILMLEKLCSRLQICNVCEMVHSQHDSTPHNQQCSGREKCKWCNKYFIKNQFFNDTNNNNNINKNVTADTNVINFIGARIKNILPPPSVKNNAASGNINYSLTSKSNPDDSNTITIEEHLRTVCEKMFTCGECLHKMPNFLWKLHLGECSKRTLSCADCHKIFLISERKTHDLTCPKQMIRLSCSCNGKVAREDILKHDCIKYLLKENYYLKYLTHNPDAVSRLRAENENLQQKNQQLETNIDYICRLAEIHGLGLSLSFTKQLPS